MNAFATQLDTDKAAFVARETSKAREAYRATVAAHDAAFDRWILETVADCNWIDTWKAQCLRGEVSDAWNALLEAEIAAASLWDRFEVLASEFADVAADLLANGYEPHELPRLLVEHDAEADG